MEDWIIKYKTDSKNDIRKVLKSPYRASFLSILEVLKKDPYAPTQSFEKLAPPGAGKYSRRINGQHRVVYTIDKGNHVVRILSAWSHYESM
ncbi:Txe/YoeB family addiction module toxin [Lacticaseibacillus mingshuiensis]|uniref:Txe/YoeB family addiction module toxin n=1 Tax=Lacticaseibacillus mingshuiensis TaxID=2799574 RepID=UPI00194FC610|nr:Txe/YoeB family addiction module toxin [Lacticaseibacillus mingshuiensis]